MKLLTVLLSTITLAVALAGGHHARAAEPKTLTLEVFTRNDSDTCKEAVAFIEKLTAQRTGLKLVVRDVLTDQDALRRYYQLVQQHKIPHAVMPGIACGRQFHVGFENVETSGRAIEDLLTVRAFTREGCPHCRDAKKFLAGFSQRWPAVKVEIRDVVSDSSARQEMQRYAKQYGKNVTGLPGIVAGGRMFVGYTTDATTGRQIELLFESPPAPAQKTTSLPNRSPEPTTAHLRGPPAPGPALARATLTVVAYLLLAQTEAPPPPGPLPPPPPADLAPPPPADLAPPLPDNGSSTPHDEPLPEDGTASEEITLPLVGTVRVKDWGLPLFTVIIGLVDGFNPCAMWVLVFLLSVLVNVKSRVRILAIAGTFVLISGLAYFAFMAAWLNVFMLLGVIRPLQIALGIMALVIGAIHIKDFFAFKRGVTLSIPESAKPGIYDRVRRIVTTKYLSVAVGLAVVLAVAVNTVELLCTAGLPALYTEILAMHHLPTWANYAYLGLYILAYMFDDSLLLAAFLITLSRRRLQEKQGRWLKLVSGVVVLMLGLAMLFRPNWLHLTN